jgi:hypothetical protein
MLIVFTSIVGSCCLAGLPPLGGADLRNLGVGPGRRQRRGDQPR